jgi:hypothetical protein
VTDHQANVAVFWAAMLTLVAIPFTLDGGYLIAGVLMFVALTLSALSFTHAQGQHGKDN